MTNVDIVRKAQNEFLAQGRPDIKTGMEVEVYQIIKEGEKSRIQRFKGIVIKVAGKSELEKTITVRRKIGAFGVEKIFPIHSPVVATIELVRKMKVRQARPYYIRSHKKKLKEVKKVREVVEEVKEVKEAPKKKEVKKDVEKVEKTEK